MSKHLLATALSITSLTGCAGLSAPPVERIADLPVVTYPEAPPAGDFVYKLPAGQPIEMHLLVEGSALADGVDDSVSASLARDLYLHREWASADGVHWQPADEVVAVNLTITLPSYEQPGPGRLHMTVDSLD